jgi:hypothetical protein
MRRSMINIPLMAVLLIIITACNTAMPPIKAQSDTPTPQDTATSAAQPTPESTQVYELTTFCNLLDSHDIASLFTSAEVETPVLKTGQVTHPVFSAQNAPASETSCVYYAFHQPGSNSFQLLQITYWVDLPAGASTSDWARVWSDASASAGQPVSGLGDGAFYANKMLTFKKGQVYLTLAITGSNLQIDAGPNQVLEIETQLARAMLSHL